MRKWLFATAWRRLMFATFLLWLVFMLIATVAFVLAGDWTAYVVFTLMILVTVALFYLVPRVSNWVEYRKWDARFDHYKDSATDGGHPEGENE